MKEPLLKRGFSDLNESIAIIRSKEGCHPLHRINGAKALFEFLKLEDAIPERKKIFLVALIKECFKADTSKSGLLLASLALLDGYEGAKTPYERHNKLWTEIGERKLGETMLRNRADDAEERFVIWLKEAKKTGKLDELLKKIHDEHIPKQQPVRKYRHNLPRRNPNYMDRQDRVSLLDEIYNAFQDSTVTVNEQLVYGMGGVGKTQIAIAYAHRFRDKYPVICWLTADSISGNAVDFVKYMEPKEYVRLQSIQDNVSALITVFVQWFEKNTGWLLIIDDVDSRKQIDAFIPQNADGHILITSRTAIKGIDRAIRIDVFDKDTATNFLLSRMGCDSKDDAHSLAVRLGCFPLALEQAAAYIVAWSDIDFRKYLSLLDEHGLEVFNDEDGDRDYSNTVNTVWEISMKKVREANEDAAHLLFICAYFAPDDIDFSLFIEKAVSFNESAMNKSLQMYDENGAVWAYDGLPLSLIYRLRHEVSRRKLIADLTKYSLVSFNVAKNSLSIHALLQEVIRSNLSGDISYLILCTYYIGDLRFYDTSSVEVCPDGLSGDFHKKLPHLCSLLKHMEPFMYSGHLPFKRIYGYYEMISIAYSSLFDFPMQHFYLRKALPFAYAEGLSKDEIYNLVSFTLYLHLSQDFISNLKDTAGYNHKLISCWVENGVLTARTDFTKGVRGEKHPQPLVIEIPYLFKTTPRVSMQQPDEWVEYGPDLIQE